ncbi:MAG: peptidoglycan recognition protein family protein [Actinomycetota bacterium]
MPRQLWIADAMREEGLVVHEEPGWRTRGSESFNPRGVVIHHTADGPSGDYPSLRIVRDGRSDLPGPLAQFGLGRSGKVYVIASGRANHAGRGGWRGLSGNSSVFGIEPENTGRGEPWPGVQLDAYVRMVAVLCRRTNIPIENICGHKEWAPGRKPDPQGIDMNWFRGKVSERLRPGPGPSPAPIDDKRRPYPGYQGKYGGYNRKEFEGKIDGNVAWLQAQLNKTNLQPKLKADGDFGALTERAVKGFQGAVGLPQDAIVGKRTWDKLAEQG